MDGDCNKSINGTFIALQIESFGPKKIKLQAGIKNCHFGNYLEKDPVGVAIKTPSLD